jgi:nicotinamidase-related amidase
MPNELAGIAQLHTAMAWQHVDKVENVQPRFIRDSPGFALIPELQPRPDEIVFDKIGMSFFSGTPLNTVLRDAGITTFIIVGTVLEIGITPTISHGVDLGYIPIVINQSTKKRVSARLQVLIMHKHR